MYETFPHTADVGLRIRAPAFDRLLAEAGRGLFSLIVANLEAVAPREAVALTVAGTDRDYLLFDWLAELLGVFDTRGLVLSEFEVETDAAGLRATARGEALDLARHQVNHEVKAITYHGLRVEEGAAGWLAEVIVDI